MQFHRPRTPKSKLKKRSFPIVPALLAVVALGLIGAGPTPGQTLFGWTPFEFLAGSSYRGIEKAGLIAALLISLVGLGYAFRLMKQVYAADTGTEAMMAVSKAVREGADAYLRRQFTVVAVLVVVLTVLIILAKWPWQLGDFHETRGERIAVTVGRGVAFLMGALFSASVGFIGMRLATAGNVRVAAAAKRSFGEAMRLAYRTGTVTGMFTCGLGLFGGTMILLIFGELAYETLLGFGFGGSLLALFMRVGGGIYTKAADVGADLVGKIEADIAEDDPRNAATIADNVGDNVGDCAGMAADVFESYAVTMVAAVILGYAALGYRGMIFPILVMAVGVISSMISTALVGRGITTGNATTAMSSINRGFWRSAVISVIGLVALGFFVLRYDEAYIISVAIDHGMYEDSELANRLGLNNSNEIGMKDFAKQIRRINPKQAEEIDQSVNRFKRDMQIAWGNKSVEEQREIAAAVVQAKIYDHERGRLATVSPGSRVTISSKEPGGKPIVTLSILDWASLRYTPLRPGIDWRAIACCLIGVLLAVALNKCTEYWTSTDYNPVKDVVKASRTGHATNIISGLALGLESAVWAALIITGAILSAVMVYADTFNPLFIAYGVALCGIGMLTLTGDTVSMDVFGPIADNANGIGEMAFNRDINAKDLSPGDPDYIPPADLKAMRQILSDLDAVGNTTKAITKGIAIGSAVIAAVSLFASFIAVLVTGAEEKIGQLTVEDFKRGSANLTVADPYVFIGMLIGAAVPFLFSSMTIRAVGRAAFLIVNECRKQFRDKDIWEGRKRPDYSRVVDICTGTAQKELIGPGLLAIGTPLIVGFLLGPFALGGFLAGMIVSGQLLAVFMSNAGGAWDNAKKMIEDEPRTKTTGKGSDKHKASVTGDTVGDPLKDTAGPAINPLIKVMNMVSLLALPLVIVHNIKDGPGNPMLGGAIAAVATLAVAWAWWQSKRESAEMKQLDEEAEQETGVHG